MKRSRLLYAGVILLVVAIGLPARIFPDDLTAFVVNYLGDALWALAITWGIEFSQLYQAGWINAIRANRLGGLIPGYTFLPSDLLMYLCGIGAGVALEKVLLLREKSLTVALMEEITS